MNFMKMQFLFLCMIFISSNIFCRETSSKNYELSLPKIIKSWTLADKPDIFIGDDLFQHINGGAEIYHEYGFKKVISGVYKNLDQKSINIEIYEMIDPKAAFGIYSFKTSAEGKTLDLNGNEGKLEDYYLNFYSNKYKVTLVGFDNKQDTINGILNIAEYISKTLPSSSSSMAKLKEKVELINKNPIHIKYIKGELALFNIYKFADLNLFEPNEGIVGYYKDSKIFIFIYKSQEKQNKIYHRSFQYYFKKFPTKLKKHKDGFSVIDKNKNKIIIIPYKNIIYLHLGKPFASKPVFFNIK